MNRKFDVVTLGEILIDFTPIGTSEKGFPIYESNPGGAPANVAVSVQRLGGKSAFIGKVGNDSFGELLQDTLETENVDTSLLFTDHTVPTTKAFVNIDKTGDRSFSFARKPGADIMLSKEEINEQIIIDSKIFHYGSLSCTDHPSKEATLHAIEIAKKNNILISYDPNLRIPLWENEEVAKTTILELLHYADIAKISDNEFEFLFGTNDYDTYSKKIMEKYNITLLCVTLGPKGSFYRFDDFSGHINTYEVKAIDTTASGDSFMGALLYCISDLDKKITDLSQIEIEEIIAFSNASGSAAATKRGGIPSIPTKEEVLNLQK